MGSIDLEWCISDSKTAHLEAHVLGSASGGELTILTRCGKRISGSKVTSNIQVLESCMCGNCRRVAETNGYEDVEVTP